MRAYRRNQRLRLTAWAEFRSRVTGILPSSARQPIQEPLTLRRHGRGVEQVYAEKMAGEREPVQDFLWRGAAAAGEKGRQRQQPFAIGGGRRARHGTAGLGRDMAEIGALSCRGAAREIEPEAELGQHQNLP